MEREEVLNERPHERPSSSVQLDLAGDVQLGVRETRQSVANAQTHQQTHVCKRRPSVAAAASVRRHPAAQVDVRDRAAVDRRTEGGEEARRLGRDGGAGRHELGSRGPFEAVDEPTTTGLTRRRRRRRRRRRGSVVDGTVETSSKRQRVRPRLSNERRRVER